MDKPNKPFKFFENSSVVTNEDISDSELQERELYKSQEEYFGS